MLKTIVTLLLLFVFSAYASFGIAWQLESVSATRARRDEDVERRSLELGVKGRIIFTLIFVAIFAIIMIASNIKIISMILGLLFSVLLVIANTYLRSNGIKIAPQLFALWLATMISSVTYAHMTSKDVLGVVYVVLQVICLIGLLVGTFALNAKKLYATFKKEEESARDLRRETGNDDPEEEERRERMLQNTLKFLIAAVVVIVAVVIMIVLEVNFDFLPPYRL